MALFTFQYFIILIQGALGSESVFLVTCTYTVEVVIY